jgi:EAL domain-containing protein (putative c-di-GMP-specific phosphodiesterase class I)
MNIEAEHRLMLESQLHNAINNNELQLHYQPQFSTSDGSIHSVEALLRWQQKDGTYVGPDEFIPVLEETGLINRVGAWVIDHACAQLNQWHQQGFNHLCISVNLSSVQLHDKQLAHYIESTLKQHQLDGAHLELEITESVLVRQDESIEKTFKALIDLGIKFAIDDFGTGYSSLCYLHRLSIDILKIDRTFIEKIPGNEASEAIARAIVGLGKSMQLTLVAEGAENEAQCAFISELGCDYVQGFLLSRPQTAEKITELLQKNQTENSDCRRYIKRLFSLTQNSS